MFGSSSGVRTEEELGEKIRQGATEILIEGDLGKKVIKIKATGRVAWLIAVGAIGVAVLVVLTLPAAPAAGGGGVHFVAGVTGFAPAVAVLGMPAAMSAVAIAVAAGGVGALNTLRSYKIVEKSDSRLVLKKKC